MAIGTRDKRFSMVGLALPAPGIFPNPDGGFNQADRQQWAMLYRGIAAGGVVSVVVALTRTLDQPLVLARSLDQPITLTRPLDLPSAVSRTLEGRGL